MKKKIIILISAVILLAVASLFSFHLFQKVSSQMDYGVEGWKLYHNSRGKFAISYPTNLNIKEYNPVKEVLNKNKFVIGWVCFYPGTYQDGCKEGFNLSYAIPYIDGKGGGPCEKELTPVEILGKQEQACITEKILGGPLYLAHPKGYTEVSFRAIFSGPLTIEVTKEMLKSFRFIDIN